MAYSEELGERIRDTLAGRPDVSERKMFGGLGFMIRGHMACGVIGDELMVRVGPEVEDDALTRPGARPMDFTGRPMTGFLQVAPTAIATDEALGEWIGLAVARAESVPPK
jgi:TfoX/Sxy family transcriptional regulator of competence genes